MNEREQRLDFKSTLQRVLTDASDGLPGTYGGNLEFQYKNESLLLGLEVSDLSSDYDENEFGSSYPILIRVTSQMMPLEEDLQQLIASRFEAAGFKVVRVKER